MALPLPSSEGCRPGYGSNGDSNVRGEEIEPTGGVSASVAEELAHTKSAVANICRHAATKSDLLNLGAVNKVFHEVASSEHVWDRLYSRDFPYHHVHLLSRWGCVGAMAGLGGSPDIPWYSEYRKRWHTERCWETGNLTRKAPVILSGHMGCVFGACFLKAPFTPGTICTGAHMEGEHTSGQDSTGEIKMWLPSRGTTVAQIVREFEVEGDRGEMGARFGGSGEVPAGMDVETFTRQEIARAGVLSLYQLPGTPQIACTTMESGVHILRCQVVAGEEHPDERGSRSKRHKGSSPGSKGYNFKAVLEVMGQEGPCSKTFVDSQSRILCLPSYDGGVRLYLLPQWITDCGEIAEDGDDFGGDNDDDGQGSSSQTADVPEEPKIYPSSTLYDDAELVVQGEGSSVSTRHRVPITALTMSNDCKSMVTGSNDALIKLWDVTREEIVHRFEGHEGFIWNVKTLDPELNTAVSTSTDGYARRWDLRQRKCTGRINVSAHGPGNIQAVTGVALRGNGHHLAAGSLDCNIYVLDLRMMKRLYIVGRHDDKVCRAHLYDEGDSNLLMTTGWDRTVRLWEFN